MDNVTASLKQVSINHTFELLSYFHLTSRLENNIFYDYKTSFSTPSSLIYINQLQICDPSHVYLIHFIYGLESHTGTPNMRDLLQTTFREVNKHVILMKLYNLSEQVWYHIKENFILYYNIKWEILMIIIHEDILKKVTKGHEGSGGWGDGGLSKLDNLEWNNTRN